MMVKNKQECVEGPIITSETARKRVSCENDFGVHPLTMNIGITARNGAKIESRLYGSVSVMSHSKKATEVIDRGNQRGKRWNVFHQDKKHYYL